jgi:cytochrome c1
MLEEPNIEPNIEPNVEIELLEIAAYIKAMKDPKKKLLATTSLRQLCQDLGISLED